MDFSKEFIDASVEYLTGHYLPKIERCVELLTDDEIWWRPNEHSNSVGNLILHLEGNIRQYVVSGVGGAEDVRTRDREFEARGAIPGRELVELLRVTLRDVAQVLAGLDRGRLSDRHRIQGREMTAFAAIYHAVEHFSMHCGQIIQITKQLKDRDLGFYSFVAGGVQRRW